MRPSFANTAPGLLACLLVLATSFSAFAQSPPTLSGQWSASALTQQWNIGEWGQACGPKPTAEGAPGGTVRVVQSGNELTISGAGRGYNTGQCWEQGPGLSRVSHSASPRAWSNRCTTAPNDPRRATVVTTLSATDTTIVFDETGSYQFVVEGQNCTASARRSRSYRLIQREGEALASPPSHTAPPTPQPPAPARTVTEPPRPPASGCEAPGPPAKLEVRPARKLLRPGEDFSFRAWVLDAQGCPLTVRPSWTLQSSPTHLQLDPNGTVHVAQDSPEGSAEIQVAVGAQHVPVRVEVASTQNYEALLAAHSFNDKGETEESAVTSLASSSVGGGQGVAEDKARKRKMVFVAVVGSGAFLIACAGAWMLIRSSRRRRTTHVPPEVDQPQADKVPAEPDSVAEEAIAFVAPLSRGSAAPDYSQRPTDPIGMRCPACNRSYPPGSTFCPMDGSRLGRDEPTSSAPTPGGICPSCGRGFDASVKVCPEHHQPLIASDEYRAKANQQLYLVERKGKICPTCGARYDFDAGFCGKDGTALVLVN